MAPIPCVRLSVNSLTVALLVVTDAFRVLYFWYFIEIGSSVHYKIILADLLIHLMIIVGLLAYDFHSQADRFFKY